MGVRSDASGTEREQQRVTSMNTVEQLVPKGTDGMSGRIGRTMRKQKMTHLAVER